MQKCVNLEVALKIMTSNYEHARISMVCISVCIKQTWGLVVQGNGPISMHTIELVLAGCIRAHQCTST